MILLNSFSFAVLVITCWFCLLTLCQSKYIEVNRKGNDSTNCCIYGACLCGSLFEALINVENNTIINITSSVPLHNITRSGLQLKILNNITITGSRVTVDCNNTGIFICLNCSNVVIQGITWDQCGVPNHPDYIHAVAINNSINVSIIRCTFQHSKVCFAVSLLLLSGFAEIQDSRFLFNRITNLSQCVNEFYIYSSLSILDPVAGNVTQTVFVTIIRTLFYHNGPYNDIDQQLNNYDTPVNAALVCFLTERRVVKIYVEDLTVSTSFWAWKQFYIG